MTPRQTDKTHRTSFTQKTIRVLRVNSTLLLAVLFLAPIACSDQDDSIVAVALHPSKSHFMYVATNQAVYKTRDGGVTWSRFPAFSARRVTTLAVDPKFPATVYAGTMGDAVYKSPDGGQRWLPHNVGLKEHVSYVNQFIFDPHDSQIIYAATTVGAFRTRNGARLWEERMRGMKEVHIVTALALDLHDSNTLYAGTTGGVYKSSDGAGSWQKVNNGLIPAEILEAALSLGVNVLAVDPLAPGNVYAGTTKGLFKSTTSADSWTRIGTSLPDQFISSLVIDPTNPQVIYIGGRAGVHKSTDGGQTWQAVNQGLETLNIRTIVMDPRDPHILYAGTNGSGLYRTTDSGTNWKPIPLTLQSTAQAASLN